MAVNYLSYGGTSTFEAYNFVELGTTYQRDSSGGATKIYPATIIPTSNPEATSATTVTKISPGGSYYGSDVRYGSSIATNYFDRYPVIGVTTVSQTVSYSFPTVITSASGSGTLYTTSVTSQSVFSTMNYSTYTITNDAGNTVTDNSPLFTTIVGSLLTSYSTETSVSLPAVYHTVVVADTAHGEFLIIPTKEGTGYLSDLVTTATATTFFYSIQSAQTGIRNDYYTFEWSTIYPGAAIPTNFGFVTDSAATRSTRLVTGYIDALGNGSSYPSSTLLLPANWGRVPIGIITDNGQPAFQAGNFLADSRLMAYPLTTNFTASSNFLLGSFTESHISSVSAAVGVRMPLPARTTFSSSTNAVTVEPVSSSFLATLVDSTTSFTSALSISNISNFQTTTASETVTGGNPYFKTLTVLPSRALFSASNCAMQTWDTSSSGIEQFSFSGTATFSQKGNLSAFLPRVVATAYSYQVAGAYINTPPHEGAIWPRYIVSTA